jgi:hypothetical protein
MLGFDLPTFMQRCKELVDQAAYWAARARHWARMALTGVGIVHIEAATISLTVGTEDDVFTYYIVNDDLNTMTFFLVSDAIPGTSFQIRNNGFGIVQVQPLNGGIVNSPGSLILRGHGSVVSLVAIRPEVEGVPAMWDLIGDVQPL